VDEIRVFWHGLDREDLPWDRKTRLALKFELVPMLRSCEFLGARRDELFDLEADNPRFDVPLRRVKKRRVIQQPLSSLAVEVIRDALEDDNQYVFASPLGDMPMNRRVLATALRGTTHTGGKLKSPGVCALLSLKSFAPHDLRRTAANWRAISASVMHGSRNVLIMPQARSRNRLCRPSPGRSTITQEDEGKARDAGRGGSRVAEDYRPACPEGHRRGWSAARGLSSKKNRAGQPG
jgi:integrase